jgi:hypothetical protein
VTAVTECFSFIPSQKEFSASFLNSVSYVESMAGNAGKVAFDIKRQISGDRHGRGNVDRVRVLPVFSVMAHMTAGTYISDPFIKRKSGVWKRQSVMTIGTLYPAGIFIVSRHFKRRNHQEK